MGMKKVGVTIGVRRGQVYNLLGDSVEGGGNDRLAAGNTLDNWELVWGKEPIIVSWIRGRRSGGKVPAEIRHFRWR